MTVAPGRAPPPESLMIPVISPAATWAPTVDDVANSATSAIRQQSAPARCSGIRRLYCELNHYSNRFEATRNVLADHLRLFGQHDLGRLDDGRDAVAFLEPHLLGALPRDHRFDYGVADADRDVNEDVSPHDLVNLASQVVASAQSRHRPSSMMHGPRSREPRIVQQIIVRQRSEKGDEIRFLLSRERKPVHDRALVGIVVADA